MSDQLNALPGFAGVGDQVDYWPEGPPMSYAEATAVGRERAADLLEVMRRMDAPNLLGNVLEEIIRRGQYGGVEIGFFNALAIETMRSEVVQFVEVPAERYSGQRKYGCLSLVG